MAEIPHVSRSGHAHELHHQNVHGPDLDPGRHVHGHDHGLVQGHHGCDQGQCHAQLHPTFSGDVPYHAVASVDEALARVVVVPYQGRAGDEDHSPGLRYS